MSEASKPLVCVNTRDDATYLFHFGSRLREVFWREGPSCTLSRLQFLHFRRPDPCLSRFTNWSPSTTSRHSSSSGASKALGPIVAKYTLSTKSAWLSASNQAQMLQAKGLIQIVAFTSDEKAFRFRPFRQCDSSPKHHIHCNLELRPHPVPLHRELGNDMFLSDDSKPDNRCTICVGCIL